MKRFIITIATCIILVFSGYVIAEFYTTGIISTGNIQSPTYTGNSLDVGASTLATRSLTVDTGGVFDINLGTAAGDDLVVKSASYANAFVVGGDIGNVGIGTATLLHELSINASNGTPVILLMDNGTSRGIFGINSGDHIEIGNLTADDVIFLTANTPRMRIISTGEVGIGVTPSGTYTLEVGGTGHFTGALTAASYADNTPFYEGDALAAIANITGVDGEIDHASLPVFAQHNTSVTTKTIQKGIKIPVAEKDAFEDKDIIKTMQVKVDGKPVKSKIVTTYSTVDGKVVATETPEYQTKEVITGTRKALKAGVKFDNKTGEFYTQTETEVETVEEEPGRNLGAMISILTKAVQQLTARIETLENPVVAVPAK